MRNKARLFVVTARRRAAGAISILMLAVAFGISVDHAEMAMDRAPAMPPRAAAVAAAAAIVQSACG